MTEYARIANGFVVELFTLPDGFGIADCFAPEIAAMFVAVPNGVAPEPGWTFDGTTFAAAVTSPAQTTPNLDETDRTFSNDPLESLTNGST